MSFVCGTVAASGCYTTSSGTCLQASGYSAPTFMASSGYIVALSYCGQPTSSLDNVKPSGCVQSIGVSGFFADIKVYDDTREVCSTLTSITTYSGVPVNLTFDSPTLRIYETEPIEHNCGDCPTPIANATGSTNLFCGLGNPFECGSCSSRDIIERDTKYQWQDYNIKRFTFGALFAKCYPQPYQYTEFDIYIKISEVVLCDGTEIPISPHYSPRGRARVFCDLTTGIIAAPFCASCPPYGTTFPNLPLEDKCINVTRIEVSGSVV